MLTVLRYVCIGYVLRIHLFDIMVCIYITMFMYVIGLIHSMIKAMVKGAQNELGDQISENIESTKVVLLASNGTICRRNTLARLHRNGIIVMRRSVGNDDDDSSSE